MRVRVNGENRLIYRLGKWSDSSAVAKAQALSGLIWSDFCNDCLDPSLERCPKVWDKLLGIARCQHLQQVDPASLPGNYTALYALVGMGPEEWQSALEQQVVLPNASSRLILDWLRRFRANELEDAAEEIPVTLVTSYELSESVHRPY